MAQARTSSLEFERLRYPQELKGVGSSFIEDVGVQLKDLAA